ncbi:MAG TPA: TetR/AcrR family transcriptional regulator [Acidimicrobiales bacterium]|nr:TetR/AcrR family transcriptional regulator [Acidimicrobiales bacterium]
MSNPGYPAPPPATVRSPRAIQVVEAARRLLESEGPDALTMRRLADVLGIRAPSIYKHFPGKPAVELAMIEDALVELGTALHRVVARVDPGEAVAALLCAYRAYALAHPNLYRLATGAGLSRQELADGLEDWAGEPFYLATGEAYQAQALWAFAHGMVVLELDDRFLPGSDLDRTWAAGAAAFVTAAPV